MTDTGRDVCNLVEDIGNYKYVELSYSIDRSGTKTVHWQIISNYNLYLCHMGFVPLTRLTAGLSLAILTEEMKVMTD